MATSTTVMAQFIRYSANGDQTIVNLKSVADAISLTKTDGSKYTAATMQELADSLGNLAFQDGISNASSSTAGLMSASDKSKLDGIAAGANKYTHPAYTARSAGLYKITVDATGHVSAVTSVAKADITGLGIPGQDTTYSVFGAATASASGSNGLVPAPAAGKQSQYLRGDGTWATPTNTTYNNATTSTAGLMSAADKSKLDGIAANANNYSHPNSGVTAGTYRSVTVNAQGHVTAGTNPTTLAGYGITDAAAKSHTHGNADITALDAGKITSGTISIDRLPQGALERCVVVADDTARFALTTSDIQKGDTVKVTSTGKMYFIVDESKLNAEDGYEVYTAGSATSVPWSGVTGKPSTYTPSSHTQAISTITGLQDALNGKAANSDMVGANTNAGGTHGLVPAPAAGAANRYLRSDGTWVVPPDTKYNVVTTSANGLMSASDKSKLDGIAANANNYSHPTYTSRTSGLYKITVDGTGHVSAVTAVAKADITGLGIPGQDTTYSVATTSANGLMSSSDKSKLDGIAPNANNYSLPTAGSGLGGVKTTSSVSNASGYTACPIIGGVVYYKDTNTTYSAVTQSANGLMLASDKKKLDGIAANANNYVHPTSSGNKHIPAGGSAGQILGYSSDGTAAWQDPFYIGSDTPSTACMWLKTE